MDVLQAVEEKGFWGTEFLMWLWYVAETQGPSLRLDGVGEVEVRMGDRLAMEDEGDGGQKDVFRKGDVASSPEAETALQAGRKVTEARVEVERGGRRWQFGLKAGWLDFGAVRLPKGAGSVAEAGSGPERMVLVQELVGVVDALFERYVGLRLSGEWDSVTVPAMRRWVRGEAGGEF